MNGYGVIGKRVAAAVAQQDDMSLAGVAERPHDNLYEVALWADMLRVQGEELFYAYMVDNQAIVIPETIDAIRALTGTVADGHESIARTNAALGIGPPLV